VELNGKRVLVVGLGKSGLASAAFLKNRGASVTATDAKSAAEIDVAAKTLEQSGIPLHAGEQPESLYTEQDLIVVSPGVSFDEPRLVAARARGIEVIGEVELAARFLRGRIVAITGSNGKTTTTTLTGQIIARDGRPTLVGGNIGTPAISFVDRSNDNTWIVLELSSFQLETIATFRPHIACILNITPDHLDRHGSFEVYLAAKARIFENQQAGDFAVLNADDPACERVAQKLNPAKVHWFSRRSQVKQGAFVRGDQIIWRDASGKERAVLNVTDIPLKGAHNVENVLAAVVMGVLACVADSHIRDAIRDFKAVEHRLEYVATRNGVEYYNDSKATNVDATIKALESFPWGIHIILGGKDKGSDYTVLAPLLRERGRRIYTIGAAAEKIEQHLTSAWPDVPIERAETLANAVRRAHELATRGDVVVLAPACASFDQFQNYEHRGRVFKELVHALPADGARVAPQSERRGDDSDNKLKARS